MQKDSQTYSQRKIHREQGMKGKGWFKSWRVSMGVDSENEGDYMIGDMPWVWVFRAIFWTHKSWGLTQGSETPLNGCRAMWTNRRSVGSLDSPSRSMCSGACSQATMKRTDWDRISGCLFSQKLPTLTHALLTPSGRCALEQGCHDHVESWDVGKIGASGQGGMLVEVPGSCSWRALT